MDRRFHRGGYRNKGLDGIRFLRTFEGDRVPEGSSRGGNASRGNTSRDSRGKFHTQVPFEYGRRGQPRGGNRGRGQRDSDALSLGLKSFDLINACALSNQTPLYSFLGFI